VGEVNVQKASQKKEISIVVPALARTRCLSQQKPPGLDTGELDSLTQFGENYSGHKPFGFKARKVSGHEPGRPWPRLVLDSENLLYLCTYSNGAGSVVV
jgi:hypothetical protein